MRITEYRGRKYKCRNRLDARATKFKGCSMLRDDLNKFRPSRTFENISPTSHVSKLSALTFGSRCPWISGLGRFNSSPYLKTRASLDDVRTNRIMIGILLWLHCVVVWASELSDARIETEGKCRSTPIITRSVRALGHTIAYCPHEFSTANSNDDVLQLSSSMTKSAVSDEVLSWNPIGNCWKAFTVKREQRRDQYVSLLLMS